ncbi:MAG: ABC transporter permease [Vicinamibacteria bacterium]
MLRNVVYAARRLGQKPGFTLVAILSLALGIGANTAIFSLVNAILLREPPLDRPEELVEIYLSSPEFEYNAFSNPDLRDFVEGTGDVFSDVSGTKLTLAQTDREGGVEMVPAEMVTGNYFTTMGVEAAIGRTILPEDDVAPGAHPVVVLGHAYWQKSLGADPGVVDRPIRIGGRSYTVIGVAPEAYEGHFRGLQPAFFIPRMMLNDVSPADYDQLQSRGDHGTFVRGRLKPGTTMAQARTSADAVAAMLREAAIDNWDPQASFLFVPTTDVILYPPFDRFLRAAAWLLMIVVGLVLLMACVNLASFLLARALDRRKEVALRIALGATRGRLIGQLLTETTLLAILGGIAGVALGQGLLGVLLSADHPLPLPLTLDLGLDRTVLGFSLLLSLAAGLFLGLAPALQTTNPDVSATIKDETAGAGRSGGLTLRNALVVLQVGTSVVLLVGAGLFLRSFQRIQTVDPGFGRDPSSILSIFVPSSRYSEEEGRVFERRLEERLLQVPGITAVGVTSNVHLNTLNTQNMYVNVDGLEPPPEREAHTVDRSIVSAGFFEAAGIHILRGRNFAEGDLPGSPAVVIVNEALAEKFWPGQDPLGRTLRRPDPEDEDLLVVGVAATAKIRSLGEAPRPFVYVPYSQDYTSFLTVVAKTSSDAERATIDLLAAARELDRELWVWEAKTMARHLGIMLLPARLSAILLSAFAVLALALAAIGLYGIVSYSVAQRSREVGIRMSLGADGRSIVGMMMGSGLKLVGLGAGLGLALSLLLTPALANLLFGVEPRDAVAFTAMPLFLLIVAALAAYLPARSASRIDPVRALKAE